jgi:hypothetical protein
VSQWRTTIGTGAHPRVNGRPEQLDLQALRRVRERLVSQRTAIVNQIRAFTVGVAGVQMSSELEMSAKNVRITSSVVEVAVLVISWRARFDGQSG